MKFHVFLRIPLIFMVDELFKISFGLPDLTDIFPVNSALNKIEIVESAQYYEAFIKIIVSCIMFCSSLCLLILPARYLIPVYRHVVSICVILVSYWENMQTLKFISGKYNYFKIDTANELITWDVDGYVIIFIKLFPRSYKLFRSLILQYCLSLAFEILQVFTTNNSIHKIYRYSFIIPTLIASIPNTSKILNTVIMLSALLQLFILLKTLLLNLFTITNLIWSGYNHIQRIINNHGILAMVEMEWYRLKIPSVLRMFWAIRVLEQFFSLLTTTELKKLTLFETVKYLLINGCDTCTAVLGMTSLVSYFCDNIGTFFQWVLLINETNDLNCGVLYAVLFTLLTMQSGLTGLDPEIRLMKLYENVHLVCLSLQDYIYNMVDKSLMYLNNYHNRSFNRHSRALFVCGFLIVFAVTILYFVLSYHSVSPWLLTVSASNILYIIKVLVLLAVYSLLFINSNRSTYWENMEDYIFYITSFSNILEFCFGIFLFLNDIYNLVYISGGVIRAIVLCIRACYKVYDTIEGLSTFIKHHIVKEKIESLPDATSVQLSELDDLCAICYQKMTSAKITKCNHYFHKGCLCKWAFFRNQCPLCQCSYYNEEM